MTIFNKYVSFAEYISFQCAWRNQYTYCIPTFYGILFVKLKCMSFISNKYINSAILLVGLFCIPIFPQERLYVFYPQLPTNLSVLQKILADISQQRIIKVFNNPDLFFPAVKNDKPDIIITKARVISQLSDFNPILRGIKGNQKKQSYILLSLGKAQSLTDLNARTVVGIINFSSIGDITEFVNDCIHLNTEIITAVKPEDLVTLLIQGTIDCAITTKETGDYFRNAYYLEFYETPLSPDDPDIITCAIRAGKNSSTVRKEFTSGSGKTMAQIFWIDLWK
jgi:hypothetical protein